MCHECGFEDRKVVRDRSATHFTWTRERRRLKEASALREKQFGELLKRMPTLDAEELLNVLGPIGVHPFLKVTFREGVCQEERRQATTEQSMFQRRPTEVFEVGRHHRGLTRVRLCAQPECHEISLTHQVWT